MSNFSHIPVLLDEAINGLNITSGKKYIDATIGGGGHASLILAQGGIVLGIDQDKDAIDYVCDKHIKEIEDKKLLIAKGNFSDIKRIAHEQNFKIVDGILFDFGVSSYQIDASRRGFSIKKDERLDMRMDKGSPLSAYEVVNKYPFDNLVEIFYRYGEEHNAKNIALSILDNRKKEPIRTTKELASIIERVGHKSEAIHPATRVFQAIRIEVNNELEAIKKGVSDAIELLDSHGRIVAISFHSLEDRIIKQIFDRSERNSVGRVITKKPLTATLNELMKNRRARSAKLRIFELN